MSMSARENQPLAPRNDVCLHSRSRLRNVGGKDQSDHIIGAFVKKLNSKIKLIF